MEGLGGVVGLELARDAVAEDADGVPVELDEPAGVARRELGGRVVGGRGGDVAGGGAHQSQTERAEHRRRRGCGLASGATRAYYTDIAGLAQTRNTQSTLNRGNDKYRCSVQQQQQTAINSVSLQVVDFTQFVTAR